MKKYILITALILSVVAQSAQASETIKSSDTLEKLFNENFYEGPSSLATPKVTLVEGSTAKPISGMPLFKRARIKITNHLRERDYKKTLELIEKEKQEQAKLEAEENLKIDKELKLNFSDPVKNGEKSVKSEKKKDKKESIKSEASENTLELKGGVKEKVTQNDAVLDADNVDYDSKTMEIVATGSPVLLFPPQGVTIKADVIRYNRVSNLVKAKGNVEVIRDGNTIYGDFMQIDMNEETSFMDNMHSKMAMVAINARKADMVDDKIILHNGKIESQDSHYLNVRTQMIGGYDVNSMLLRDEDKSSISDNIGSTPVNIKTRDLIVDAKKNHDVVTLKKAQIKYGDTNLFNIPSMTFHTNKRHDIFEANYPEFGSRSRLGMFIGPGFVFDTPLQEGSTVKLLPILNNSSGIGFGGMLKYRSSTNYTDLGYGSSSDVFVMFGKQQLDDKLFLQYGVNSYMDEWFMGPAMPKYTAELVYKDQCEIPSAIAKDYNTQFRHRFSFGYMQNNEVNRSTENIAASNIGTTRTKYMAEITQPLYRYTDRENLKFLDLALVMQGSAALYGTGDTQFIGRIGPRLHTQYKRWMQDVGFFASAYQDGTPMQMYDIYRYGHANFYLREAFRLSKYLTVAWSGYVNVTNDAPSGNLFQENSFIIAVGPDDLKFNFGYDFIRERTYFGIVVAMDTKGSSIEYQKMEIKHPDRLAKKDKDPELKVFDVENNGTDNQAVVKKMMYAEVIDIEDPDREQI